MPPPKKTSAAYDAYKGRQAAIARQQSVEGRDVGPLPPVADPARKNRGLDSLERFCLDYFPARFPLPFSPAHRQAIARMEACTNDGGLYALAFQRGGGKTTLAECAALRALLYGLRRFVVIAQATQPLAGRSLKKIQRELEANDLLAADFPEVCHPVRCLERIANRAKGQTLGGEPTRMEWLADGLVLPTVRGSASSGAAIQVVGLTGAVRGLSAAGPGGELVRPDLVILDDCQTRESAKSPTQTNDREAVVRDDVLGLAGPTTTIAAVMLCTPIYPGDLSERFLDRDRNPEWHGTRTKMLPTFPANMPLWDEYWEARRRDPAEAAAMYRDRRAEMDAGAVVTWPERVREGEASGLQSAMHLYYRNPRGFAAEYNCEPELGDLDAGAKELTPATVAARLSGLDRHAVPREAVCLTAFVDPGVWVHWYAVVAWAEGLGGAVVDYGCWPRQSRAWFEARDPRPGLRDKYPGHSDAQLVYAGLRDLLPEVLGRAYPREGGGEARVERCLIDAGFEGAAVAQYVRQSPFRDVLLPSKGFGRTATARGVSEWKARPGERVGTFWRVTPGDGGRGRLLLFDPDHWKTQLHAALTVPPGGPGAVTLWGRAAGAHEMVAHHCAGQYSEPVTVRGVTFDKWQDRPDRPDVHYWDTLVGAMVAASYCGLRAGVGGEPLARPEPRKRVKLSEIQARKRAGRAGVP